jgi:hypothetical protein
MYRRAEDCRERVVSAGKEMLENGKELLDRGKDLGHDAREFLGNSARVFQR